MIANESDKNSIIWYGERGVVNAIVTHLIQRNAGAQFLDCIQWANSSSPDWLKDLRNTKIIVELGLAEFGNPDLMLVCESAIDSRPFCVFVEAKVIPYVASAISNNEGMATQGFNSACNGQLSLKYRFAKALQVWDGHQNKIEEPAAIHQAYRRMPSEGGIGDPQINPRKLQKTSILNRILAPLNLSGIPLDHFAFVALTWDREPFFSAQLELMPRFLDESGTDLFQSLSAQCGWLGYQNLSKVPGLIDVISPPLRLMVETIVPTPLDLMAANWPRLVSQPINQMSEPIPETMKQLESLAVEFFSREAVQFHTGSISIKSPSRVEAKIVPHEHDKNRSILLGVRPEWPLEEWAGLDSCGYKVMDQPFAFVRLPAGADNTLEIAAVILKQLKEMLAQS